MKKPLLMILSMALYFSCSAPQENTSVDIPLEELSIDAIQGDLAEGRYTSQQLVKAYLYRIEAIDKNGPALQSVIMVNPDALALADSLDAERQAGTLRGPLHGIPVLLKDNINTHDKMPTTAGARVLANSYPLSDSRVAAQLRAAGAIILGKTNLSEWANFHSSFSSSGWSAVGGQTKNPYDTTRNPCGSSSGSGVAVSANLCVVAIGTETNGSIVCPSNNNGIVGIKPTVGLISRSGIVPISATQDTPGPMARSVRDAALVLGALVGVDSTDEATLASQGHTHSDYTQFLKADGLKGKRIGIYQAPLGQNFKVDTVFAQAVALLKAEGAEVITLENINTQNINGPSFQVLLYEFKAGLNEYLSQLGPNAPVKSLEEIIAQTFTDTVEMKYFDHALLKMAQEKGDLTETEYLEAKATMLKYAREEGIDRVMAEHNLDAIIAPTGGIAWKTDITLGDNFGVFSSSPAAIAGYPSITVPMGWIDGMPLGISFFGKAWSEPILLEIAYAYEQKTQHRKAPDLD
ncbi:amidase [Cytophagales bacterium LB-30]|uniref:Amidase n=1 Tax=Shiella aurantiaca TaxID=3058365 RepID=A0ABT8F2L8_9BACT|nr:amidase [Shiella aurantiaca]MDN4164553.1 amidase [Shiella aurantiaca]